MRVVFRLNNVKKLHMSSATLTSRNKQRIHPYFPSIKVEEGGLGGRLSTLVCLVTLMDDPLSLSLSISLSLSLSQTLVPLG